MTLPNPDPRVRALAEQRQNSLTKPPGSLGQLETLAVQIASWQADPLPSTRPAAAVLFAADHGVTRHQVSPYPSSVTGAMLANFAHGGAAASVLAQQLNIPLHVVDVGVSAAPANLQAMVVREPVANAPLCDLRVEDAMSVDVFEACVVAGRAAVERLMPLRVLLLGEMGIGNSTAAAVICAALLGGDPREFVGAGTGATGSLLDNKQRVVSEAVQRLGGETRPLEVLRRGGGREIAALYGAMHAALERRVVVVVDGFIATSAALVLLRQDVSALPGLVFAHVSNERAHRRVLGELGARPLLDLGMRLGEASGALSAFPLIELACALHGRMATFEQAQVPDREST